VFSKIWSNNYFWFQTVSRKRCNIENIKTCISYATWPLYLAIWDKNVFINLQRQHFMQELEDTYVLGDLNLKVVVWGSNGRNIESLIGHSQSIWYMYWNFQHRYMRSLNKEHITKCSMNFIFPSQRHSVEKNKGVWFPRN
jgi:hypothetical protein